MSVLDAAYNVVHNYPGGASSLAPRLGKSAGGLSHEVAGHGTAKFGLVDAVKVTEMTGNLGILNAFAAQVGCMVLRLPDAELHGKDVMVGLGVTAKEFGDFVNQVVTDASDGHISENDIKRIEKEWAELVVAGQGVVGILRATYEQQTVRRGGASAF